MPLSRRELLVAGGTAVAVAGLASTTASATPGGPPDKPRAGVWLAGDTHVHDDHSADGSLPRQQSDDTLPGNLPVRDQIGQAERTGLDFLPLTDHRTYDQHWDPQWTSSKLLLVPGEEVNGSPHAIVLGAVDTVVDGANPPGSPAFRHVQQSIWDAHAQDAVWSTAHPDNGEYTPAGGPNENASAIGVDTVEVWNVASDPDAQLDYAENRWNHGYRFGVTGASDCHFRELWSVAGPGQPTTWVFAADRSVGGILDALRAGRTTVAATKSGPFLTIEADLDGDGHFEVMGGDEVVRPDRKVSGRAALRVRIRSGAGSRVLVYASPGRSAGPVATFSPDSGDRTYTVPITLDSAHTWFRAEVRAPGALSGRDADPTLPDQLRGATSPIFVSVGALAAPTAEIALPPAVKAGDHAVAVLGEPGEFAGFADVATQDGITHVVAEVHRHGRGSAVVYRRIDEHGEDAHTIELSDGSPTAAAPRIAVSGRDVWVVWQDSRGAEQPHKPVISVQHSDNGGRSFERVTRLAVGAGRAVHPAVALLDGKHPVIVWSDNSGGAFDVYAQVLGIDKAPVNVSAAGKTTSPGTATDARSPRYPASLFPTVTVGHGRRITIAWQDNRFDPDPLWTGHTPVAGEQPDGTDPDNWQILCSTRAAGRWSTPVSVSATTTAADRHPDITVDRDGALVAIWETKAQRSSGANLALRSSHSSDGGATWSPSVPVGFEATAMSQRPRLHRDSHGVVRAVWYDTRSADWRWKVFTAGRPNGAWGPAERLTTLGNGTWPAADGDTVVFTSDRAATRPQRDATQGIYLLRVR